MYSYGKCCIRLGSSSREICCEIRHENGSRVTGVTTESSSHLPLNMYNLGAFDLAVVSSTLLYSLTFA